MEETSGWNRASGEGNLVRLLYFDERLPRYGDSGHLFGNLETEETSCARIIAAYPSPGVIVVNVNYRHTPEFQWPTQFNDAWDSYEWLSTHISRLGGDPSQVVVGGISAGGGLAASVATRHHELMMAGQSSLGLTLKGHAQRSGPVQPMAPSPVRESILQSRFILIQQNQMAPILPWSAVKLFSDLLGAAALTDPYLNVALNTHEKIKGMPKASYLIAG
ncbi:uncharacterized protein Z519_01819 [Cladophialophora bantiana CBS 173.52]|uniref:Alpha/beta hydrolase fold-3 domain-containing protein n=1 Tax=Cladophialophora bantiana (strain ATCC 10958 / CBS 173.52 / CDC B-1940 / NIH 8579) TaxID=1442370 RepID=A0A0D2I4M8_CLAB1|nr:uncharacterized protein Z519_01819 [Cladophialophora bantiana CBS 173.52]KIW98235.1 hypothetical protein Z519_01819 [Cladophialophora bantiana CBS 173.52]